MARLAISLLGPLEVRLDVQVVTALAYDKVWALLAYLAIEANRPHRRDALVGLLWPHQPDQAARTNLRQALTQLRQAIGDHTAQPPFLLIARETIQFNCESDHDLDVTTLEALLATCDTHPHRHPDTCTACARRHREAAALYRGSFLEGFFLDDAAAFEEWALLKRQALHYRALHALAHLAAYYDRRAAYEDARRYAQRQLELDPWNESAHRQLMRILALTGQRSAALRQYETCRRVLADGLGVEPEAETSTLYEQIKRGDRRATGHVERPRTNLPAHIPLTPFFGREGELAQIAERIEHRDCRLLTLVGPGGIGKTRLALQAAQEQLTSFSDGVYFVPLAPLSSAELLIPTIANVLAFIFHGPQDAKTQLLAYLCEKEMLLVLDNFEQLVDGADVLCEIVQRAPKVTLLVTSRERLNLRVEWILAVTGMPVPESADTREAETSEAVQLFVQTARQAQAEFMLSSQTLSSIVRICQLVDGMPLGIELAAAWVWTQPCAAIVQDLECSLDHLATTMRDIPARHRSIRAVFEHSWDLLSPNEQRTLAALSVFRGGFTPEAAEQIVGATAPLLSGLTGKSVLRRDSAARYDMHELVRQYAAEKLQAAGEAENMRNRHLQYFLALTEAGVPHIQGTDISTWVERLERDYDNLRAAMAWSNTPAAGAEARLRFISVLWLFWFMGHHLQEGFDWLAKVLPARSDASRATQARALSRASILLWRSSALRWRETLAEEGLACARELDDRQSMAYALAALGTTQPQDRSRGAALLQESLHLFRQLNERWGQGFVSIRLGENLTLQRKTEQAVGYIEEGLALFRSSRDQLGISDALSRLGEIALSRGEHERAAELFEESLAIKRHVGDPQAIANSQWDLGAAAQVRGDYGAAHEWYVQALAFYHSVGYYAHTATLIELIELIAGVAAAQAQLPRAVRLWAAIEMLRERVGAPMEHFDGARHGRTLAAIRAQLDEAAFAAAWAAGQAMPLERAIAYALSEDA